jgi:hypothetical protein
MKTFTIKKEIVTKRFTFKEGDVITVYENTHYFSIETVDVHKQKLSLPYVFGLTISKNGGFEMKPENMPKARIDCAEFIKQNLYN